MKEFLVLEKRLVDYYKVVFANDLIEYSTERALSNTIQAGVVQVVENDFSISKHHTTCSDSSTAYIEKFKLNGERREITKGGDVRLFETRKVVLVFGHLACEYQLLKVVGKLHIYLLVNDKINYPNIFFYNKNGTKEIAPWQVN